MREKDVGRPLTDDDLEAALIAGLFLSAGGSGREAMEGQRRLGRMALAFGGVNFVAIDELDPDDTIIVATAVGAPGGGSPVVSPRDSVESARTLLAHLPKPPAGVICGHVPGFNGWMTAAALGVPYVDVASNGRGHPTVMMGGMGLASRPDISITQVGTGGRQEDGSRLQVVATGNISNTEKVLRRAAALNGGLVMASRGPLAAGFVAANGAPGAITFQLGLGAAMLAAEGPDRVTATAEFIGGEVLVSGEIVENTVSYADGFDVGRVVVRGPQGEATLGVFNEYMTAEMDGERVATFPDMIGSLDPATGDPVAISRLAPGAPVAVLVAHRSSFPIGKGALDPAVYPEAEAAMGVDLVSWL